MAADDDWGHRRNRRNPRPPFHAALISILALACAHARPVAARQASIVGTWRVAAVENRDSSGALVRPFGERPAGYFVYTPDGHFSMQIARTPLTAPFAAGTDRRATEPELRAAFEGYFAWYGTYTVNAATHTVTHHIAGSLWPSYTGTDQPRPFRLSGDTLILGDERRARRVLVRERGG